MDKSFTLIEMVVVIAITGIISGLVLANMRAGGQIRDLNSDAEKLAGIIKQAQMMALSGKQINSSRPPGGYGVYLTADSYKLFADDYDNDGEHQYDDGDDTVIQTFNFTEHVKASDFNYYFTIFFPPKGLVYVGTTNPGVELSGTDLIILKHDSNRYVYIEVNAQGQVDVRKTQ